MFAKRSSTALSKLQRAPQLEVTNGRMGWIAKHPSKRCSRWHGAGAHKQRRMVYIPMAASGTRPERDNGGESPVYERERIEAMRLGKDVWKFRHATLPPPQQAHFDSERSLARWSD